MRAHESNLFVITFLRDCSSFNDNLSENEPSIAISLSALITDKI
jgi:hypothetical protein